MYLHHTILPEGLTNTMESTTVVGFSVQVRIGFPRGVPLSLLEGFEVDVDDGSSRRHFSGEQIAFGLRGRSYRPADLIDLVTQRWEMGEVARLEITLAGGLPTGPHRVTVTQFLRVGATPEPARTVGTRTVALTDHQPGNSGASHTPPANAAARKGSME